MKQSDFFGGIKSAKFTNPGDRIKGVLCEEPRIEQERDFQTGTLLTWRSGDPKMQMVITLQTELVEDPDDDGRRRVYVNKKGMKLALQKALRDSHADAFRSEGELDLLFTEYGEGSDGFSPPKLFAATYDPPPAEAFGPIGVGELGETVEVDASWTEVV